jgi:hypothetical protein
MITSILSNNEPTVNATLPTDLRALPEAEDARENIPRSGRPESSAINLVCADVGVAADPSQAGPAVGGTASPPAAATAGGSWMDDPQRDGIGAGV